MENVQVARKTESWIYAIPLMTLGFALGWTPVLAPIHEFGHWGPAFLLGVRVTQVEWAMTWFQHTNDLRTDIVIAMGSITEMLVIAWFIRIAIRKRALWVAQLFAGYLVGMWLFSFSLAEFNLLSWGRLTHQSMWMFFGGAYVWFQLLAAWYKWQQDSKEATDD